MESGKALPKSLPGAVVAQYRTAGGKTYGPYWFRIWREGGRLKKAYVRRGDLDATRAACERGRESRRSLAKARAQVRESRGDFALLMRLLRRVDSGGNVWMSDDELQRAERFAVRSGRE